MPITEAQVLSAARERTGITASNAVGSEWVSDAAIRSEIRENVLECCKAFGASTSLKEVDFITVRIPTLTPPGPPVCTPSPIGGTLAAGSYAYFITALVGTAETLVGPVGLATTTSATSSVVLVWTAVANATTYKVYGRSAGQPQYLATVSGTTWTDTGAQRPASGAPITDSTGGWLQDYEVDLFIASDVLRIDEVIRSDAYRNETFLEPAYDVDPLTGQRSRRGGFVDQGLQQNAFEVIQAQERYREERKYSWAVVNINGVEYLRLMPNPDQQVLCRVSYISQADTIPSLPEEARSALENAACRAILDCVINRMKAEPVSLQEGPLERRAALEAFQKQRDRYESRFARCLGIAR